MSREADRSESLLERRSRSGWWAIALLGGCYGLFAVSWFFETHGRSFLSKTGVLVLISMAFVTVQLVWPTLLGWGLAFAPGFGYALMTSLMLFSPEVWELSAGSISAMTYAVLFSVVLPWLAFAGLASFGWPRPRTAEAGS